MKYYILLILFLAFIIFNTVYLYSIIKFMYFKKSPSKAEINLAEKFGDIVLDIPNKLAINIIIACSFLIEILSLFNLIYGVFINKNSFIQNTPSYWTACFPIIMSYVLNQTRLVFTSNGILYTSTFFKFDKYTKFVCWTNIDNYSFSAYKHSVDFNIYYFGNDTFRTLDTYHIPKKYFDKVETIVSKTLNK